jgi:hypothetical protein
VGSGIVSIISGLCSPCITAARMVLFDPSGLFTLGDAR